MIRKCFSEEVKASNRNWKVNGSAVCFLYNIFSLCYFYNQSLYCFNLLFSSEKSGWLWKETVAGLLWKESVVEWCGKWSRRRHRHCSKWSPSAWTQASTDVTGTVQNDHRLPEHKLRVLFATGQWHRPPHFAGTHAMAQAAVATRLFAFH